MSELDRAAVDRELVRLGEPGPSPEELRLVGEGVESDPAVATVAALHGLAEPADVGELPELERARVWKRIEARARPARGRRAAPWAVVAIGLSVAAALTFMLTRPRPSGETHELASALQVEARAGLSALGISPGSASQRAQALADEYGRRLAAGKGAG